MRIGLRRAPIPTDALCPVCNGLIGARSETPMVYDGLSPSSPPTALAAVHVACHETLRETANAVLECRENPRGPAVDEEGAVSIRLNMGPAGLLIVRVTGAHRALAADVIRNAAARHNPAAGPITNHIRRALADAPALIEAALRFDERPGPPPGARGPNDPAMTVNVHVAPRTTRTVLTLFDFVPQAGAPPLPPQVVDDLRAYLCQRSDAGLDPNALANELSKLPRVMAIDPTAAFDRAHTRRWTVTIDPNRPAAYRTNPGAIVASGPPTGSFASPPASSPLSPSVSRPQISTPPGAHGGGDPGCAGALPPPGEVVDAMLSPLDGPEVTERQRKLRDSWRDLARSNPVQGARLEPGITFERDPETLGERAIVAFRGLHRRSTVDVRALLSRIPLWSTALADGLSLIVNDETPEARPDGENAEDEVDLRDLPKNPRAAFGTTTVIGKPVAFRDPFWKAIFGLVADGGPAVAVSRSPAIHRIRERLIKLLDGADPETLRFGVLVEYDALTDHALVKGRANGREVYIHTSLGWTMEHTMPPPAAKLR